MATLATHLSKIRQLFVDDIPVAVLEEFPAKDASILAQALKSVGQKPPSNLFQLLKRRRLSKTDENVVIETSPQLQDLYFTDFEMARLKDIKEAKLLRFYLKIEKNFPPELSFFAAQGLLVIEFLGSWNPWLRFARTCFIDTVLSLWGDPFMLFRDPFSFILLVWFIPALVPLLFSAQLVLMILDYVKMVKMTLESLSVRDGGGLSMVSWDDPGMFNRRPESISRAKSAMSSSRSQDKEGAPVADLVPRFDVDIAFLTLYMSALIYERNTDLLEFAASLYESLIVKWIRLNEPIPDSPFLKSTPYLKPLQYVIERCLIAANRRVVKQAHKWGLKFMAVSDLNGRKGPCGGLFWSEEDEAPFIIAVFKGTTPTNYTEYMVDATFQKTDARAYLYGAVHEGFYNSLFPTLSRLGLLCSPYGIVCSAIRQKVREIKEKTKLNPYLNGKIPLYVAGHSLGGALASLFYCRLKKGKDLDDICELRDAYTYGCPAVGDTDFATGYESDACIPFNSTQHIWRVIDDFDLIPRVPFTATTFFNGGAGDEGHLLMTKSIVKHQSILDYCVIGTGIRITRDPLVPPKGYLVEARYTHPVEQTTHSIILRKTSKYYIGHIAWRAVEWVRRFVNGNSAQRVSLLVPFFIRDHFCSEYNASLEASEEYLRFATESKNKLANLIGGIALRGGLEELEGLEKDIKRVVKDPAQLS